MHKHHLQVQTSRTELLIRFKCRECGSKFVFWRDGINKVLLGKGVFKPTYRMGMW